MAFDGIKAREDHRLELLETGERLESRPCSLRDRVADFRIADVLDIRDEKPDFADAELADLSGLRAEHTQLERFVVLPLRHQPDLHARPDDAVDDPDDDDDAAVRVE